MNNFFVDNGRSTGDTDLYDNFTSILSMVQESLSEKDQARLVQALIPKPNVGKITPHSWMLNVYNLLTQAVQIMDEGQLERWQGWEVAIEEIPVREAQRLQNLDRIK